MDAASLISIGIGIMLTFASDWTGRARMALMAAGVLLVLFGFGKLAYQASHPQEQIVQALPSLPTPTPIFIAGEEPVFKKAGTVVATGQAAYNVGVNIFFGNLADESFKIQNYFTVTLRTTLDERSSAYTNLFATMRGRTDTNVRLGQSRSYGTVGPHIMSNYVSAYLARGDAPIYISGETLTEFLAGRTAFYYTGSIVATRGDDVITVPYCGLVVHYLAQDATVHIGQPVAC